MTTHTHEDGTELMATLDAIEVCEVEVIEAAAVPTDPTYSE